MENTNAVNDTVVNCNTGNTSFTTRGTIELNRYDKRLFTQFLERSPKRSDQFICPDPECRNPHFSINMNTGEYDCYGNRKCTSASIEKALDPFKEMIGLETGYSSNKSKQSQPEQPKVLHPVLFNDYEKCKLVLLPEYTDKPEEEILKGRHISEEDREKGCQFATKTIYRYSDTQWVERRDYYTLEESAPGFARHVRYRKSIGQWHSSRQNEVVPKNATFQGTKVDYERTADKAGMPIGTKGDKTWFPYRYEELKLLAKPDSHIRKTIVLVEGENKVEALREVGFAATTFQGSDWGKNAKEQIELLVNLNPAGIFFLTDNDSAGRKKGQTVFQACAELGLACVVAGIEEVWHKCKEAGDIKDYIKDELKHCTAKEKHEKVEDLLFKAFNIGYKKAFAQTEDGEFEKKLLDYSLLENEIRIARQKAYLMSKYRISEQKLERLAKAALVAQFGEEEIPSYTPAEILAKAPAKTNWLVENTLPTGDAVLFPADPGTGKTLIACKLAVAIAGGGTFHGERCKKGKVLIIPPDQSVEMTSKYLAYVGYFDLSPEDQANIQIFGGTEDPDREWNADKPELLDRKLKRYKADLVILDTLRDTCGAGIGIDENSPEILVPMRKTQAICKKVGAALLIIHHNNKDKSNEGVNKASGSSAIAGAVQHVWNLNKVNPKDANDKNIELAVVKARGAAKKTKYFQIISVINEYGESEARVLEVDTPCAAPGEQSAATSAKEKGEQNKYLNVLAQAEEPLTLDEITEIMGGSRDTKRTYLNTLATKKIISKNSLANNKSTYYLTPAQKQAFTGLQSLKQQPTDLSKERSDAEENEGGFDFESSIYNPDNGFNPADFELATPKGADAEPEQAVAGDREAIEAEVEEAVVEPSVKEPKPAQYRVDRQPEQATDTVTVDGITYRVGEIVDHTDLGFTVKAKVLGKGWVVDDEEEGVTIEFLEGWRDSMYHINGHEWIIAPGQIQTTFTHFLSKIADSSEQKQAVACDREQTVEPDTVTVDGITYRIGEIVNHTDQGVTIKARVLGKGWVIDELEEGVTVEYLEGHRDTFTHVNGNEWVIAPGSIESVYTFYLSKIPNDSEQKQAIACDREQEPQEGEPGTVTVDGKTYRIGETINHTHQKKTLKAKVLGKGWVIEGKYEGVTIEFLEGWKDPMYHINGNEWVIAPRQIRTTYTRYLSRPE